MKNTRPGGRVRSAKKFPTYILPKDVNGKPPENNILKNILVVDLALIESI